MCLLLKSDNGKVERLRRPFGQPPPSAAGKEIGENKNLVPAVPQISGTSGVPFRGRLRPLKWFQKRDPFHEDSKYVLGFDRITDGRHHPLRYQYINNIEYYRWNKILESDLIKYTHYLESFYAAIVDKSLLCSDINCTNNSHLQELSSIHYDILNDIHLASQTCQNIIINIDMYRQQAGMISANHYRELRKT